MVTMVVTLLLELYWNLVMLLMVVSLLVGNKHAQYWVIMHQTGVYRSIQDHMGPYRALRDHAGPCGTIHNHVGPYCTIRDNAGPYLLTYRGDSQRGMHP